MTSHEVPSLLAGRYLVGAELGSGGAAVVHRAWDTVLMREVAVKLLRTVLLDPAAQSRFEQEARLVARLDHPGLVAVYDAALVEDRPFLVMELVDGHSLAGYRHRPRPATAEVTRIGHDVAEVLAYIHEQGVTHRDVKPGNILLGTDGRVKLADFGIARILGDHDHPTATGTIIGTAAYLAPEQVRGEPATDASDVYALGLTLMELLRGRPVYQGAPDIVALARLTTPPPVDAAWPPALGALLADMTATVPAQRPRAGEVALRFSRSGTTESTVPLPSPLSRVSHGVSHGVSRRVSRRVLVGGVVAAVVLVPGLVFGGQLRPDRAGPGASPVGVLPTPLTTTTQPATTAPTTAASVVNRPAAEVTTQRPVAGAPAPAPAPESEKDKDKNENKGKGNNNGKGKGKKPGK